MTSTRVDRAALVRRALVELVAERGFRGTSMGAVAERAGVATGTAYVHYASKDELIIAAYREVKLELGRAAVAGVDPSADPEERFRTLWKGIHTHLAADPVRARFLVQIDASPYATEAHAAAAGDPDDELMAAGEAADIAPLLVDLPLELIYDLGMGPIVRLVASGVTVHKGELATLAEACWRAITRH
jgi:TetR/AcrR family transcriptional repressor of multidrug resistance operon